MSTKSMFNSLIVVLVFVAAYSGSLWAYALSMTIDIALHCSLGMPVSPPPFGVPLVSIISTGVGLVDVLAAAMMQ